VGRAAGDLDVRRRTLLPALALAVVWLIGVAAALLWSHTRGVTAARLALSLTVVLAGGIVAVVVAGPLTRAVAVRRSRRSGIHLGGQACLAAAAHLDTLILDGVGSLVDGKSVSSVDPVDPEHLRNLRWFAGALEHHSDHPLGVAVARLAPRGNVTTVEHHPGRGISGSVDRHPVRVGSAEWLGSPTPEAPAPAVDRLSVEVDGRVIGTIDVVDQVRDDAAGALDALSSLKITPILAAEGACERARTVANRVGVERVEGIPATELATTLLDQKRRFGVLARPDVVFDASLVLTASPAAQHSPTIGLAEGGVGLATEGITRARRLYAAMRSNRMLTGAYAGTAGLAAAAGILSPVSAAAVAAVGLAVAAGLALRP